MGKRQRLPRIGDIPPSGAGPVWTQARLWGIYDKGDGKGTYVVDGGGSINQDTAGDVVYGEDGDDLVVGGLGRDYLDSGAYNFRQIETLRRAA